MIYKKHQRYIGIFTLFFLLFFYFIGQSTYAQNSTERRLWPEIQALQVIHGETIQNNEMIMYIPNDNLLDILTTANNYNEAHQDIRRFILQAMISKSFSGFISKPFPDGQEKIVLLVDTGFADFIALEDISQKDMLDNLILNKLIQYKNKLDKNISTLGLEITQQEYDNLHDIYLFKSNEDLYGLGYELVSYRYRTNNDKEYRRHNISLAFSKLGNVRVINPNETFSFQTTIQEANEGKFMVGYAIVGGKTVSMYAGGLCGASTAFYQGILTNTAIDIIQRYPHTQRYANLYDSFINGVSINIPGLDSTVYFPSRDIKITNKRNYPLVVVLNYDGTIGGMEEVFSLAKISDKGSLVYKGTTSKKCYVREINGVDVNNCYQGIF